MKHLYHISATAKKTIIFLLANTILLGLNAQDINYSQLHYTPMQVNPAYVATADFSSIILNHRMNRIDLNNKFKYSQLTVMTPFYDKKTGFRSSGLGISLFNDKFGAFNQFVYQGVSIAYSRQVQLTYKSSLGLGIMGGAYANKISTDNFTTGNQWVPHRGFNPDLDLGENFDDMQISYLNSAAGINYVRTDDESRQKFNAGFSMYNMNMPNASFLRDEKRRPFYVAHVNYMWFSSAFFDISSDVLFSSVRKINQLNVGTVFSYKISEGSGSGLVREGSVDIITRYVLDNYIVLGINIAQPNFVIGFSYDIGYKKGPNESPVPGTTEFMLSFRKTLNKK